MSDVSTPGRESAITLRPLTQQNIGPVLRLKVADSQAKFVATNAVSIAQAYVHPEAVIRVIYADETPVGFAMLEHHPGQPDIGLWRYMMGHAYQGLGFGRRALEQIQDFARTLPGVKRMLLSYVPGEGCPRPFYEKLGFTPTGNLVEGEIEMVREL